MVKPWELLGSRVSFEDRWLTVQSRSYRLPDGQVVEPFHVVQRSDWVQVIALTDDNQIVLTREFRAGIGQVITDLPGGMVDATDADPLAAAARELREETGFECRDWRLLGSPWAGWANQTNRAHFALGLGAQRTASPSLDASEDIAVIIRPWAEFVREAAGGQGQAYHLAALFLAQRALGRSGD